MKDNNKPRSVEFILPPRGALERTGVEDPLHYYYQPITGPLYRARIQTALTLLSPPYKSILEIGYGSGLLIPTLTTIAKEVHAVDRDSDPIEVGKRLKALGVEANLLRGDAAGSAYPDGKFNLIVAISILEHIPDIETLLDDINRMLAHGGELLVGMPRVDPLMTAMFRCIGWDQAKNAHVTTCRRVIEGAKNHFALQRRAGIPQWLPGKLAL